MVSLSLGNPGIRSRSGGRDGSDAFQHLKGGSHIVLLIGAPDHRKTAGGHEEVAIGHVSYDCPAEFIVFHKGGDGLIGLEEGDGEIGAENVIDLPGDGHLFAHIERGRRQHHAEKDAWHIQFAAEEGEAFEGADDHNQPHNGGDIP